MLQDIERHYQDVIESIRRGRLIPFLGAGVNMINRPAGQEWTDPLAHNYLPNGAELAKYLARERHYPGNEAMDLTRVSQFRAFKQSRGRLYDELREVFCHAGQPTQVHTFLAHLSRVLRAEDGGCRLKLVMTTNYDRCMEMAFEAQGIQYDVVSYVAELPPERPNRDCEGRFVHLPAGAAPCLIQSPNDYREIAIGKHPVILKVHGTVHLQDPEQDSFVVTEDDYIEYLTVHGDALKSIPYTLVSEFQRSHFLFLGYSLRDWNMRVILRRIDRERRLGRESWAVQRDPGELETLFWDGRNVEIIPMDLGDYINGLEHKMASLQALTAKGVSRDASESL